MAKEPLIVNIARYSAKNKYRFMKFLMVGAGGALIQIGVTRLSFFLFTHYLYIDAPTSNTLSVVVAMIPTSLSNFYFNSIWTFKAK